MRAAPLRWMCRLQYSMPHFSGSHGRLLERAQHTLARCSRTAASSFCRPSFRSARGGAPRLRLARVAVEPAFDAKNSWQLAFVRLRRQSWHAVSLSTSLSADHSMPARSRARSAAAGGVSGSHTVAVSARTW